MSWITESGSKDFESLQNLAERIIGSSAVMCHMPGKKSRCYEKSHGLLEKWGWDSTLKNFVSDT